MTYKAPASGLNLGGGKSVIIGNPHEDKTEALFRSLGRYIETLGGRYIVAEDVGISTGDIHHIQVETSYVVGADVSYGGSGDPSPFTALGVLQGMRACVEEVFDTSSLEGRTVAVQGLGHVGYQPVPAAPLGGGAPDGHRPQDRRRRASDSGVRRQSGGAG